MSCDCENKKMAREIERFQKLAKAWAKMKGETAVIYLNADGSYGFASLSAGVNKPIVEYITQY